MSPRPAIVHSDRYECDIGVHVFPTRKYRMIRDRLVAEGVVAPSEILVPAPASREDLLAAHTAEYLDDLERLRWTPRTMWSELPLTVEIVSAYVMAAGGTLLAAREAIARGAAAHLGGGFHHAFADKAEGFCYINDLAVAIRVLQREGRIARAAVVDLDVHQGNGTAGIFAGDRSVFTLSIHQEANYPVKTPGDLDVGLDNGVGDEAYARALDDALASVWAFAPELVLYQAGADPYVEDMLGGLALTRAGLAERDRRVIAGCARRGIPCVVTLGGGYARNVDDTVAIHTETIRQAVENARPGALEARDPPA
jgi:acetoin utilization deacetylase AcuC-like enzyme